MLIPVPKLAEEATAGGISAVGAGFIAAAAVGLVAAAAEVIHYFRVHRAAPLSVRLSLVLSLRSGLGEPPRGRQRPDRVPEHGLRAARGRVCDLRQVRRV